jgi:hypothetical protein
VSSVWEAFIFHMAKFVLRMWKHALNPVHQIEIEGKNSISEVTFGQNPRDNLIVHRGPHHKVIARYFHSNLIR